MNADSRALLEESFRQAKIPSAECVFCGAGLWCAGSKASLTAWLKRNGWHRTRARNWKCNQCKKLATPPPHPIESET